MNHRVIRALIWIFVVFGLLGITGYYVEGNSFSYVSLTVSLLLIVFLFLWMRKQAKSKKEEENLPPVSKEKEAFYMEQGLTKEEMNYFRQTMNEAKLEIIELEKVFNESPRLISINHRYQTVETAKNFFQVIANNPLQLSQVDRFLYRSLPDLVSLSAKLLKIEKHPNKNKATLQVIEKSTVKIEELCQQIEEDYLDFQEREMDEFHTTPSDDSPSEELDRKDDANE